MSYPRVNRGGFGGVGGRNTAGPSEGWGSQGYSTGATGWKAPGSPIGAWQRGVQRVGAQTQLTAMDRPPYDYIVQPGTGPTGGYPGGTGGGGMITPPPPPAPAETTGGGQRPWSGEVIGAPPFQPGTSGGGASGGGSVYDPSADPYRKMLDAAQDAANAPASVSGTVGGGFPGGAPPLRGAGERGALTRAPRPPSTYQYPQAQSRQRQNRRGGY